jgi:Subtilase family
VSGKCVFPSLEWIYGPLRPHLPLTLLLYCLGNASYVEDDIVIAPENAWMALEPQESIVDGPTIDVDPLSGVGNEDTTDSDRFHRQKRRQALESVPWSIAAVRANSPQLPSAVLNASQTAERGTCFDPYALRIAIIDSGADTDHPDIPCTRPKFEENDPALGNPSIPTYGGDGNCRGASFGSDTEHWFRPGPNAGHGTHILGIIGAIGNNNEGVIGVIPNTTAANVCYIVARVFADSGQGQFMSVVYSALDWALSQGANVINMSFGVKSQFVTAQVTFDAAFEQFGSISVAAAGNYGGNDYVYPAAYNHVISVGAVNETLERAAFSQVNDQVDIMAPGTRIESTSLNGTYAFGSGTSVASAVISGVIGRIWSICRECRNEQVQFCLLSTARDLGVVGRDDDSGYGLVNTLGVYDCLVDFLQCCKPSGRATSTRHQNLPPGNI